MTEDKKQLDFATYSETAWKTAVFPGAGEDIFYPLLGLGGETGEVMEKIKKMRRGDPQFGGKSLTLQDMKENPEVVEMLKKELGDVLWYLNALCITFGFSLAEVAQLNNDKLLKRLEEGKLKGSGDNR